MSKKFFAIHKSTGKRWKPHPHLKQRLLLDQAGFGWVATDNVIDGMYDFVEPLGYEWKIVYRLRPQDLESNFDDGGEA